MNPLSRTVELDVDIYPLEALRMAREAYVDHCDISVADGPRDRCTITIQPRPDAPAAAVDELLNYMLGAALEILLRRIPEGS